MFERIDRGENNPLIKLYFDNKFDEFKNSIASGYNINWLDEFGFSLLQNVIMNKADIDNEDNKKFFEELLLNGVITSQLGHDGDALSYAISDQKDIYYMKRLLEEGAFVDNCGYQYMPTNYERSSPPIFDVVRTKNIDKLKLILEYKPDLEKLNWYGTSILNYIIDSSLSSAKDMFPLILDAGASVDQCDKKGFTIFHKLASVEKRRGLFDIFDILIKYSKDINIKDIKDAYGSTPFYRACRFQNTAYMDLLFKNGSDINEKVYNGSTIAMFCAANKYYKSLNFLLKKGARTDVCNEDGDNIAHSIISSSYYGKKITKTQSSFLSKFPHLLNNKNKSGKSPMEIIERHFNDQHIDIYNLCFIDKQKTRSR